MKKYEFPEAEFLAALSGALAIKSVGGDCGPVTPRAPLGEGIYTALEYMCALGQKMGFRVKMLDGYAAWIEAGQGEKLVGVLAHMDTVGASPADWDAPPFELTVRADALYGRGAADNKGPAVLSLFALRALAEAGELRGARVRLILGGDEERPEWRCMERYKKTEEIPHRAFTPDSRYPVTYAEKGILQMEITGSLPEAPPLKIHAGSAWNVVPDYACAALDGRTYEARGRSAHAMVPHLGENAIIKLASELRGDGCSHPFAQLLAMASLDGFNIRLSDDVSGEVTINPAIAECCGGEARLCCDLRLPVKITPEEILSRVNAKIAPLGFEARQRHFSAPLYVPRDSELVTTLMSVYREITGRDDEPQTSGGGTYAKAFPNAVAFGAALPGEQSNIHEANEHWSLESARVNFQIVAGAMRELAGE